MTDFDLGLVLQRHPGLGFSDIESWLLDNIGPGGGWLTGPMVGPGAQPEPEPGDAWGVYQWHSRPRISIVDPKHALLFQLKWC